MSYRQPRKITNEEPHQKLDPQEVKARSETSSREDGRSNTAFLDEIYLAEDDQGTRFQSREEEDYRVPNVDEFLTYDEVYDEVGRYQKKDQEVSSGRRITGKVICFLQAAVSAVLLYLLFILNILPMKILLLAAAAICILWVLVFLSQNRKLRKLQAAGMIISIFLSIVMVVGALYLAKTNDMLRTLTGGRAYDINTFNVAVRADDPAQTMEDARNYVYAVQSSFDGENLQSVLRDISLELDTDITTVESGSVMEQADALMNGEVGAIIYNDAFTSTIIEKNPEFESAVRVLKTYTIKTESAVRSVDVNIADSAFLVFISGNDAEGEVSMRGRSDVDIVAGVNVESKQILLLTIPRDYYVEFPGITAPGERDKLTHSGIYGMEELLATVENLLKRDINYYIRLNFSSMRNIVNALGGVTIYNEQEFVSNFLEYHYPQGWIYDMDGELTLRYVQERYAFEDGDFARGRHQVQVIQAMLDKLMSVNTLTNYNNIADAIASFAVTNIPESDVKELIRLQLSENPEWHIVSYQLLGDVVYQPCQSANGAYLSVDMPYVEAIENAEILLSQLFAGTVLSEDMQLTDDGQLTYVAPLIGY